MTFQRELFEQAFPKAFGEIIKRNPRTGEIVQRTRGAGNLITDIGADNFLGLVTGASDAAFFPYLAIGNGTGFDPAYADVHLEAELIANEDRYPVVNSDLDPLSVANCLADTSVSPFRRKLILLAVLPETDGNDDEDITEAGLVSEEATPVDPEDTSGILYNHLKFASAAHKTADAELTIRFIYRG